VAEATCLFARCSEELARNGVELRKHALVERVLVEDVDGARRVCGGGCQTAGRFAARRCCRTQISRARSSSSLERNIPASVRGAGEGRADQHEFLPGLPGIRKGESIPPIGDLIFLSDSPRFSSDELVDFHTTSRTFSVYYPGTRPGSGRYTVVCSLNARYEDWNRLPAEEVRRENSRLIDESIACLERFCPRGSRQDRLGGDGGPRHN